MNERILHALLYALDPNGWWGLPALLWGPPGVGKTSLIARVAKMLSLPFERLSPGERGEGAFGVVPVPTQDGVLSYPPPDWTRKFRAECGGILFVDECNLAPPAIQGAMLGLVQLRTIGSHTLPKRTRVLGAANETMDAAGGWDLAPALANRFGHYDFSGLEAQDWIVGLLSGFQNGDDDSKKMSSEAEEQRVLNAWPSAIAASRGMVSGFISRRPGLLHAQPKREHRATSRAWPSRRTVEYVVHALASAQVHNLHEIDTDAMITGFVGAGWVQEFAQWRAAADLPDAADLLDGKVKYVHDSRRLDRSIAVLGSCAALVIDQKAHRREERGIACWGLIDTVSADAADVTIPATRALLEAKMFNGAYFKPSREPLSRLAPVLQRAGLRGAGRS